MPEGIDEKTVSAALRKALGIEDDDEETPLSEALARGLKIEETINALLNRYDKGQSKKLTKLEETLTSIAEKLEQGGGKDKEGGKDDIDLGDLGIDVSKLPDPVKQFIARQNAKTGDLTKTVEDLQKTLREQQEERKKGEAEAARRDLHDAIRRAAVDKEKLGFQFDTDPEKLDLLVEHLESKGLVRRSEDGKLIEFNTGVDKLTREPVWESIHDGLKKFGNTSLGKVFRPAAPGSGVNVPGGGGGSGAEEGKVPFSQIQEQDPAKIRELADAGKIDFNQ